MPAASVSDLVDVFGTRHECCRALLQLSRRQRDLIAADDYTQLLAVLGQKQRLLGRLDELNRQHPDLRQQWRARRDSLPAAERQRCEHLLAEMEQMLAALTEEERESTDLLAARRDETQRQLHEIACGTEVHQAYRDEIRSPHRRLDVGQ